MRTEKKSIKTKLGLLFLAEQLGNVSQACKMMGHSVSTPQNSTFKSRQTA
jgi:hypothetical protein